jgi:hypothetical protein
VARMTWCHQSQIAEWLPWVGRHDMEPPKTFEEWAKILRRRFERQNRELKIPGNRATEVFTLTAWGEVPTLDKLVRDFPSVSREASHLDKLRQKMQRWKPQ